MKAPRHHDPESGPPTAREGASRGQILILFAIFLVSMMGILGLATDLGMAFAQRRTMQSAADAGAMAGARAVARWTPTSPISASGEVTSMVAANRMDTEPVIEECLYVDYDGDSEGACTAAAPEDATGVSVRVRETHDTFFIRVVPGAPETVTVTAAATAHVQRLRGGTGPFLICGPAAADVTGDPTQSIKKATSYAFITVVDGKLRIKAAAIGRTFRVHDPQISQNGGGDAGEAAGCGAKSARFNGLNDEAANGDKIAPAWFDYLEGTKAGPTRAKVNGIGGCPGDVTATDLDDCVMILPVMTNSPAEDDAHIKQVYVLGFAAFMISRVSSNEHNGTLVEDFIVSGPGTDDWCRDCGGVVVVKLTS